MNKILLTVLFSLVAAAAHPDEPYHFIKEIPIGGEGGWDYLSVDSAAHRLYVSHATKVVVIDLRNDQIIGEITNTPGVHGIAVAPELNRGFVSCGSANTVAMANLKTLEITGKVQAGQNPDSILYEPGQKEIYAFNGRSDSATVFPVNMDSREAPGNLTKTIPLDGKPEFACADPATGRVYDNIENKNEVAVIDTRTHTVVQRWPIAPGESASGMAIDLKHHRLFLGCDNQLMVMMDGITGKTLASAPIGGGVDANAFDPGTQLAFASCGDGTTTIAKEEAPDKLTVVQKLETERGARTMALDPTTHNIYLATAKTEPPAQGQRRGKIVPGTFKILVYGMSK